jgi:alpha-L-fucosidase
LVELLTRFGKIDLLCLDQWLGADVWPEMRDTIFQLRALQPDVMLRCRGIGNYGDYFTPERYVPGSPLNTGMPWMVIHPLARSFSYDPQARYYKGWRWIIRNLVDSVAKGGNFMVGVGADETGWFHPKAIQDLEEAGEWLRVNGEAIYATRPHDPWSEGDRIRFTRSKDRRTVYAISQGWPGRELHLRSIQPEWVSRISLLGSPVSLSWRVGETGIIIDIPRELQPAENRPCKFAYAFQIK